jgi:hypothetical protein
MNDWPESWAVESKDKPIGEAIVHLLRPFIIHLQSQGLTRKTVRRHLDNLWAIGGEIIREVNDHRRLRFKSAEQLLLDTIEQGEAPLIPSASEADQRSPDATARKLHQYLTTEIGPGR